MPDWLASQSRRQSPQVSSRQEDNHFNAKAILCTEKTSRAGLTWSGDGGGSAVSNRRGGRWRHPVGARVVRARVLGRLSRVSEPHRRAVLRLRLGRNYRRTDTRSQRAIFDDWRTILQLQTFFKETQEAFCIEWLLQICCQSTEDSKGMGVQFGEIDFRRDATSRHKKRAWRTWIGGGRGRLVDEGGGSGPRSGRGGGGGGAAAQIITKHL